MAPTVFKRVKLEASDGRPPIQYRIQLVDESLVEEAIQFMIKNFLPTENILVAIDLASDEEAVAEAYLVWKDTVSKGLTLVALLEDAQGNRGSMISCNVLHIKNKEEHTEIPVQNDKWKKTFHVLEEVEDKGDVFALYDCEAYIHALGLSVASDYEGRGIGGEMLRTRAEVCRMTNTLVTATVFTGYASQKLAAREGFHTLSEMDLTDYRIDGEIVYRNLQCPVIKWMAKRY